MLSTTSRSRFAVLSAPARCRKASAYPEKAHRGWLEGRFSGVTGSSDLRQSISDDGALSSWTQSDCEKSIAGSTSWKPVDGAYGSARNSRMNQTSHQKTDAELWPMLDQAGLWLVYGGGVLAEEDTLRKALHRAHELSARGSSISEIVRTPGDGGAIPPEQIHRLCKRLGLEIKQVDVPRPATEPPPGRRLAGPVGGKAGESKTGSVSRTKGKPNR